MFIKSKWCAMIAKFVSYYIIIKGLIYLKRLAGLTSPSRDCNMLRQSLSDWLRQIEGGKQSGNWANASSPDLLLKDSFYNKIRPNEFIQLDKVLFVSTPHPVDFPPRNISGYPAQKAEWPSFPALGNFAKWQVLSGRI